LHRGRNEEVGLPLRFQYIYRRLPTSVLTVSVGHFGSTAVVRLSCVRAWSCIRCRPCPFLVWGPIIPVLERKAPAFMNVTGSFRVLFSGRGQYQQNADN